VKVIEMLFPEELLVDVENVSFVDRRKLKI